MKAWSNLCSPSAVANTAEEAVTAAREIGYPVVLRPAFTLGGTGGGFADDEQEFLELIKNALSLSPVHQVLIEKSVKGFKEIEYEVIRDANDTAITVCNMENLDPGRNPHRRFHCSLPLSDPDQQRVPDAAGQRFENHQGAED